MSVSLFAKKKRRGEKIAMATCYDWSFARLLNQTDLDAILVGDSSSMVMLGHSNTATMPMQAMLYQVESVARGAPDKFIVADLPFGWAHKGTTAFMEAVTDLVAAGAQAIKIEGVGLQNENIARAIDAGIPVMAHLGLTPQHVNKLGGYRVQGKTEVAVERLVAEVEQVRDLGCFSVVLECVTTAAAQAVCERVDKIATIGIGAGDVTDGQVLVLHDLLGMTPAPRPKFVREFADLGEQITGAVGRYVASVKDGSFPAEIEAYGK